MKFSHDQAFKNLIADYVLSALKFLFPELAGAWPDNVSIVPIRQEQLKQRMGDSFRELDIPLEVKFLDGSREALIVVIETESRDRADFLKYLAIVCVHISMQKKTNRVVPAVVYPFRRKPFVEHFTLNDDTRTYMDFSCVSCVLSKMDALKHEHSRNIVARLCLPLMAHDPADKLRLINRAYEGLVELEPDYGMQIKYSEFIEQYTALEMEEKRDLFDKHVERSPFREKIMTLASILKDEGKAEGAIQTVLSLHENGALSVEQARSHLKLLVEQGVVPKAMLSKALRKIRNNA